MRSRRKATIQELRHVIDSLPLRTRIAMLEGISHNDIIVGGYTSKDGGVCPMLAAHRRGGRTNAETFAATWDRFGGVHGRRARRATERELLILTTHLEMSLLAEAGPEHPRLAFAVAEHRRLTAANDRATRKERLRAKEAIERTGYPVTGPAPRAPATRASTEDPGSTPGSSRSLPFRRRSDYERVLARLEAQTVKLSDRRQVQKA